jgi:hypothetical protein
VKGLLATKKDLKVVKKNLKVFPEDVLDELIYSVANWFKLRNVKGFKS